MRNIKQQWLNFFNMNLDMQQDLIHKVHYLNLKRNSLKLNIPLKTFTLKHIFLIKCNILMKSNSLTTKCSIAILLQQNVLS